MLVFDPEVKVEMLRMQEAAIPEEEKAQEGTKEDQEDEHDRRKRQVTLGFGMNRG